MKIKAVDETVYATAGVHIRASYTTESDILDTLGQGESITRTGICENGWSRVNYNGSDAYIYGDYLTTKAPKKDAEPAKTNGKPANKPQVQELNQPSQPAPIPTPFPEEVEQRVFGTVLDVSMTTLTIQVDENVYTLNIMDAEHKYANGIQTGNIVKITYIGDLNDPNVVVTKVEDDDPNTSAAEAIYVENVVDAIMNTVSIETADGIIMTFETTSATNNVGSFTIGTTIEITADATEDYITQSIMTANEINAA